MCRAELTLLCGAGFGGEREAAVCLVPSQF